MDLKDYALFKAHQIAVVGDYARIDIPGDGENLVVLENST